MFTLVILGSRVDGPAVRRLRDCTRPSRSSRTLKRQTVEGEGFNTSSRRARASVRIIRLIVAFARSSHSLLQMTRPRLRHYYRAGVLPVDMKGARSPAHPAWSQNANQRKLSLSASASGPQHRSGTNLSLGAYLDRT